MLFVADTASVQFGQAVDEIVFRAFDAVVHTEIDDLHVFGYGMTLHELLRIAVSGTEEKEVDLVQRQFIGFSKRLDSYINEHYVPIIFKKFP